MTKKCPGTERFGNQELHFTAIKNTSVYIIKGHLRCQVDQLSSEEKGHCVGSQGADTEWDM